MLNERAAIITGAGKGIGKATALKFASEGAKVAVISRTPAEIEATANEITSRGGSAIPIRCDIANREDVENMISEVIEAFGRIDILVNNAARNARPVAELIDQDLEHWDRTFEVNVRGTMLCSKYALMDMIPRRSGNIINVSSSAGRTGIPGMTQYCASKWAILGFTQALAAEVGKYNIRVNCMAPGAINTELLRSYHGELAKKEGTTYEVVVGQAAAAAPLNKIVEPDETADALLYLASDLSSAVHGQTINVNAGSLMS